MKKFVVFAGIAVVALASCSKTENVLNNPQQTGSAITFQPLAAVQTKSTPITKYETETGAFRVYGWYQASDNFDPSQAYTLYMNNVLCSYVAGNVDDKDGEGTWRSTNNYYWPKNGKLTFSAYYPANADVTVDAVTGISIKDYTIADATNQVDLMYSDRVFDRVSSTQTDDNKDYDGVDLVFNHALSAADFSVKTAADYGTDAIKVYSVKIVDACSKGNFAEGYETGKDETHKAKWSDQSDVVAYTVSATEVYPKYIKKNNDSDKDSEQIGATCILLPQTFSENIKVVVTYGIKYVDGTDAKYLDQVAEFPLKGTTDTAGNDINGWEMGKWYHYTLTFTLDTIYFAPSVKDWVDVNVKDFVVSK